MTPTCIDCGGPVAYKHGRAPKRCPECKRRHDRDYARYYRRKIRCGGMDAEAIYQYIEQHAPVTAAEIGKTFGVSHDAGAILAKLQPHYLCYLEGYKIHPFRRYA